MVCYVIEYKDSDGKVTGQYIGTDGEEFSLRESWSKALKFSDRDSVERFRIWLTHSSFKLDITRMKVTNREMDSGTDKEKIKDMCEPVKLEVSMQNGKMYYIAFNGVKLIVRYSTTADRAHHFFSHLHYWEGFERYHTEGHCVISGIEEIREATPAEKHNLFRHEVAKNDV